METLTQGQTPFAPMEEPNSTMMEAAYKASDKIFGKVLTPMKVYYTRMPDTIHFSNKIQSIEDKLSIGKEMTLLVKTLTAMINGCGFCIDIARYYARKNDLDIRKFNEILNFKTTEIFSEKEKAGLLYAEEVTLNGHVKESTLAKAVKYFDEKQIVEIAWMVAAETYYNKMNLAFNIGSDGLENSLPA